MGKSKKGVSHGGPHKNHGPKRKMFHEWSSTMRLAFGKAGLLTKYHSLESFILSCQTRGLKHGSQSEWEKRFIFFTQDLKTKQERDEWLKNCKSYKDPVPKQTLTPGTIKA